MLSEATRSQIDDLVKKNRVVLFMKGSRSFPQCGFSATVVSILGAYVPKYETVNVLASPEMRDGIKEYSSWPTIPQLYIDGKFVGGCDIVKEMHQTGELGKILGVEKAPPAPSALPTLKVTAGAHAAILDAQKDAEGDPLRITIGPRHEYDLFFDKRQTGDVAVDAKGFEVLFDPESASRAGELSIDIVDGQGFRVESSNAPSKARSQGALASITAGDLKKLLDTDRKHVLLLDVRPEGERKLASIPGHEPLDPATMDELESLPDDVRVVVYCHHGQRSRAAAEQLVSRGVKNVFNLEGGVEAYAAVDGTIPRY